MLFQMLFIMGFNFTHSIQSLVIMLIFIQFVWFVVESSNRMTIKYKNWKNKSLIKSLFKLKFCFAFYKKFFISFFIRKKMKKFSHFKCIQIWVFVIDIFYLLAFLVPIKSERTNVFSPWKKAFFIKSEMIDRMNGDNSMNGQFSVSMTQTLYLSLNMLSRVMNHECVYQSKFQSFQILLIECNEIFRIEQTNKQTNTSWNGI